MTSTGRYFKLNEAACAILQRFIGFQDGMFIDLNALPADELAARSFFEQYLVKNKIFVAEKSGEPALRARRFTCVLLSSRLVSRMADHLGFMLRTPFAVTSIALCISLATHYLDSSILRTSYLTTITLQPWEYLSIAILFIAMSIFHECGHATACHRFSGLAGPVKFIYEHGLPSFAVDVSPMTVLDKHQKLVVTASGVYFQILFLFFSYPFLASYEFGRVFMGIGLFSALYNAIPFYKNDGYWALCDLLGYKLSMRDHRKDPQNNWTGQIIYTCWMNFAMVSIVWSAVHFAVTVAPRAFSGLADYPSGTRYVGITLVTLNLILVTTFSLSIFVNRFRFIQKYFRPS